MDSPRLSSRLPRRVAALPAALSAIALLAAACATPRVHRLTDVRYLPKPSSAAIDCFVGKLDRPYESIAVVDSERYGEKDNAAKAQMLEDLKKRARRLGADAVQDVRLLPVHVRGIVPDERAPVIGAWKQGRYDLYFLRGEAAKYVREIGLPPSPLSQTPGAAVAEDEPAAPRSLRHPAVAEDELPPLPASSGRPPKAVPATPEAIRVPAVAADDGEEERSAPRREDAKE